MSRRLAKSTRNRSCFGRLVAGSLVGLALAASGGCGSLNLRGDPFPSDETFQWSGRARQADNEAECFGFSNKARQIEQECGAR